MSESKKQAPGEFGKDFRGDRGHLIIGHVKPPEDHGGQINDSYSLNTAI